VWFSLDGMGGEKKENIKSADHPLLRLKRAAQAARKFLMILGESQGPKFRPQSFGTSKGNEKEYCHSKKARRSQLKKKKKGLASRLFHEDG